MAQSPRVAWPFLAAQNNGDAPEVPAFAATPLPTPPQNVRQTELPLPNIMRHLVRPGGLGVDNFADIQRQLEAIRQFSATPLQLPYEELRESSEFKATQISPKEAKIQAATEIAEGTTEAATKDSTEKITQKVTPNDLQLVTPLATPPETNAEPPLTPLNGQGNNATESIVTKELASKQRGTLNKRKNISKTLPFGDMFQISLHGLIWTYIPGLSEYPQKPKFARQLGNLETSFSFSFPTAGRYLLTFSRQFPSTGELEYYKAEIIVKNPPAAVEPENQTIATIPSNKKEASTEQNLKLHNNADKNMANLSTDINYRITSKVIADVRQMLKKGELAPAFATLNSWPAQERGDIFDTAAQRFLAAGMHAEAAAMWRRNVDLQGDLQDRATVGLVRALSGAADPKLLSRLSLFLELAKQQQNAPPQEHQIKHKDFVDIFQTITELKRNAANILAADKKNSQNILSFYQTYINLYPDKNSPEVLYNMAMMFEKPGENQDIRRARQLYSNIQLNYPVDKYKQRASKRLHYLNRQFFQVR